MLCINPSAFGYGEVLFCKSSDQSPAFAGVRLFSAWSLRPPAFAGVRPPLLRSDRPPFGRSFSAFPPPPDRLCRRSTCGGVGCGAINRPSASAFGWVALVGFASLRSLGGVLSPLRSDVSEKKIAKGFAFHNFFSDKNTTNPTIYPNFAL